MTAAQQVLQDIERRAETDSIPFIGPDKGQVLIDVIHRHRPRHIVEVGTNIGYSAIIMAEALDPKDRGKTTITSIEINPGTAAKAQANITQAQVDDVIDILVGDAKEVISQLKKSIDMLFLDAVKTKYFDYLKAAEPKFTPGAVIVADNVGIFEYALKDYLEYVRTSPTFHSYTRNFDHDAVEVSRYRSENS